MYRNSQFILSHLLSISYTNLSFYKTQNNCGCLQYFRLQPQTCCDRDVMTGCEKFACSCQFLECFESGWYISSYISCRTSDTSEINQFLINLQFYCSVNSTKYYFQNGNVFICWRFSCNGGGLFAESSSRYVPSKPNHF